MAGETKVNVQKLKDVGVLIGYIVDEHKAAITDLSKVDPNAGKFDAAEWLEDLFVDRRDAIKTHMDYLGRAFTEINEGLVAIAKEFEGVDSANADAIAKFTASAKGIIGEMGKAEYEPKLMQGKTSYESGDDKKMNDIDSFDYKDPKNPKILEFDPSKVPGMDVTAEGLGKDNNKTIDFGEQKDLKGDHSVEIGAGPPEKTDDPKEEPKPEPKPEPKAEPQGLNGEPKEGWPGEKKDYDWDDKTFRYYNVEGKQQNVNGHDIWWTNGQSYIQTTNDDGDKFFIHYTGDESKIAEPPNNRGYPGESKDTDWGGKTFRYYNVDGHQQTHNGNDIWWTNGEAYTKGPDGEFVKYPIKG